MPKQRFKVLINWYSEVLTFYTHSTSSEKALKNAINQCAKKVGYEKKFVEKYVMDPCKRRWEVSL